MIVIGMQKNIISRKMNPEDSNIYRYEFKKTYDPNGVEQGVDFLFINMQPLRG